MEKVVRKLAVCCLLLFAFAGSVAAQNDPLHVIKKDGHYLAHVYDETAQDWVLQNADEFGPNCLWYSGNTVNVLGLHHNYYFVDGNGNYRFLSAPLQGNGTLSLSASLPSIQLLRNTDQIYYFYDWDSDAYGAGLARGHQHTGVPFEDCNFSWGGNPGQCWEVYWIEYNDNQWKLTEDSHYSRFPEDDGGHGGVPNAGLYRSVSVTEHPMEIISETGGAGDLTVVEEMEYGDDQGLSISVSSYTYTYTPAYTTYVFEGGTHNYYNDGDQGANTPGNVTSSGNSVSSYVWTISGEGAEFLSFASGSDELTSIEEAPTLYYIHENQTGHKWAVITVTITFTNPNDGSTSTQVRSAMVLVKTSCHNPAQSSAPVITYEYVTVSWYPTAESYVVSWKKASESSWTSVTVGNVQSYTIAGLDYDTDYEYKVEAACTDPAPNPATVYFFHTNEQPGLLVYGAVFGGGRMGDVGGKTQVAIINCDSIHAIYGGNDITKTVFGDDGATITIGVEADDPNDFDDFGITEAPIRIGDVYGGGNGYYAYNGTSFEPASYNTVYTIAPDASILEMTQLHQLGDTVWTNTAGSDVELVCPTIKKTNITVTNDYVKIDSIFGGAKNAILNATSDDVTININGGTIFTVFGGNNFGGSLGYQSQERIFVSHTTTETGDDYHNGTLGRDFGVGYLFGGGNKVQGQHAYVTVTGGQLDTIFGGGNEADVRSAQVTVNCQLGALADGAYGQVYTDAIGNYSGGDLTDDAIDNSYNWDRSGIYNIHTLFGGNNRASMEGVPTLILTSGGIGTVYGGGNEGDMLAQEATTLNIPLTYGNSENVNIKYGTHVQMNSTNILIDYLYGGCQKSNVDYSTFVELMEGHVGTVYGGCNISGDVGSSRVNPNAPSSPPSVEYQEVQGGTYVMASGGYVYHNLFGGSNGFYHCNDGISYVEGVNYCPPENYVGWAIPTHNETHAIVTGTALIKGNVYAGGNMAPVGFTDATVGERSFPQFVGLASLRMNGGEVIGNVFGGGNMASILGGNEVMVSGGRIGMTDSFDGALYGGNDRSGQAGQISNRVFPESYNYASDGYTSLTDVNTYVSVTGKPDINTVYGGGNGDYDYVNGDDVIPEGMYCSYDGNGVFNDKPIQTNTFVDINITGNNNDGQNGGHINTVYGGGNGVTVYGSITVFLNVEDPMAYDQVGTIFGGNNKDNVVEHDNAPLVPDIILLHGQVGTVYGGCNRGAMTTGKNFTIDGQTYYNVGSMVRLRKEYRASSNAPVVIPDAVVSQAVYGGCRMNNVTYNTLVIVEGGAPVPANLFGGCDISGMVNDTSYVVVTGGNVNGNIYGGGNGNYTYGEGAEAGNVYLGDELVATENTHEPPTSSVSRVDIMGGQIGTGTGTNQTANVFGGGFGEPTSTIGNVFVNVGPVIATSWTGLPVIYGDVYGGSAFGNVNTTAETDYTILNFFNGTLHGNLYGGGLGRKEDGEIAAIEAKVFGKVFVNISNEDQLPANCFIDLRDGNVYGCNNQNGSPQDDVTVHVWKTAFVFPGDDNDYSAETGSDPYYAINQVFGGGNQADYAPMTEGVLDLDKKILVYVHNCLNTIRRVFSGGNAAAASRVSAIIDGGRMDYVFGGGNGEVTAANIGLGGTDLEVRGGIIEYLFGGSNTSGDIAGPMYTEVNNDSGCSEDITEFYGGCNLAQLSSGNTIRSVIKCGAGTIHEAYGGSKLADIVGNVVLDVRGGTIDEVYGGSKGDLANLGSGHIDESADIDGKVTLNLEGGIITDAFGGSNINGVITDSITVNVIDFGGTCGLDLTNVYGGGNVTPYAPTETSFGPVVNVMHIGQEAGIRGKVFGGGKGATALVTANPVVNFGYNATTMQVYLDAIADKPTTLDPADFIAYVSGIDQEGVVHADWGNVFGGGDLAPVSGNTTINYYQGEVTHKVVGGGNQADINGNTMVYVMGGTIGTDGNATTGAGKGVYGGCNTSGNVSGNVLVQLTGGTVGVSSENTANIHGGGYGNATTVAGNVTVNFGDNTNVANENITLYGDLYGGSALGSVNTDASNITTVNLRNGVIHGGAYGGGLGDADHNGWGWVYGKVFVNVGYATDPDDPTTYTGQANLVDCDVYGCNNLNGSPQDEVQVHVYQTAHTPDNIQSNLDGSYAIHQVFGGGNRADYTVDLTKTYVYVHGCENTIYRIFGGGNAAEVYGVDITVDGGRFDEFYGGGNGEQIAANVGYGGINILIRGGYFNLVFNGSNLNGTIVGSISFESEQGACGDMTMIDHFLGSNQVTIFGDVSATLSCSDDLVTSVNLYCGSNRAQIFGNINVTIKGGVFENVYGGSKGRIEEPAYSSDINIITKADSLQYPNEHLVVGEGGNVTLTINGGTIGNLFGACDLNGNVEGKVSITVDDEENDCGLYIGNIYGGGHVTDYSPTDSTIRSPKIMVLNATVGGPTSDLPILGHTGNDTIYEGNVFGGGYYGDVTCHPEVIIGNGTDQSLVNIEGNVYGGGKQGNVIGNAEVVIVPVTHQFTYTQPSTGGVIRVIDSKGLIVPSGTQLTLGEHLDLKIEAIPSVYGFGFDEWTVTGTGASVTNPNSVSTVFTMGTANASVATTFISKPTHTLTVTQPAHGSISVKDGLGVNVDLTQGISEGAVLSLVATPAEGYKFVGWAVTQGDGYMTNPASNATSFIMGTVNTTITAIIEEEQH